MKCSLCNKRAFFKGPLGPFCEEHLLQSVRERARKEIEGINEKILLAVSGGKDSLVLMDVMAHIYDKEKLVAVTIVEGAGKYRLKEVEVAKTFAQKLGIRYYYVTFKELFGLTLDEMVSRGRLSPCTYCGVFRRRALEYLAEREGAVVATGHTLDDEAHTALLNLLRGSWEDVLKINSRVRLKPLRKVYEVEVAAYAKVIGVPFQSEECPYIVTRPSLRARLRERLFELEEVKPGTLLKWREALERLGTPERRVKYCKLCGYPTSPDREICRACELAKEVGAKVPKRLRL